MHCDVTDWNVIGRRDRAGRLMPVGVIDFGDVTRTLRVCELAVAASIAFGHEPDDPICAAAEIVRGFDAACPLEDAELEVLPDLIAARAAIVAVGTEQQARLEPHNDYAQRVRAGDWAICIAASEVLPELAEAVFRLACGRSAAALTPRVPRGNGRFPGIEPGATVDLSPSALDADAGGGDRRIRRGALACDARAIERRARDGAPRHRRVRAGRAARCARRWRAGQSRQERLVLATDGLDVRLAGLAPAVGARGERVAERRRRAREHAAAALPGRTCTSRSGAGAGGARPGSRAALARRRWLDAVPAPGPLLGLRPRARRRALLDAAAP